MYNIWKDPRIHLQRPQINCKTLHPWLVVFLILFSHSPQSWHDNPSQDDKYFPGGLKPLSGLHFLLFLSHWDLDRISSENVNIGSLQMEHVHAMNAAMNITYFGHWFGSLEHVALSEVHQFLKIAIGSSKFSGECGRAPALYGVWVAGRGAVSSGWDEKSGGRMEHSWNISGLWMESWYKHVRCNPDVAPRLTSGGYEDKVDVITPNNILFIGCGGVWSLMKIKLMLLPQSTYCS